jgi:hypothetical protein
MKTKQSASCFDCAVQDKSCEVRESEAKMAEEVSAQQVELTVCNQILRK